MSVPQVYGKQEPYINRIPDTSQFETYHTCTNQSDLTDAKIKVMDLTELLRLQSQLKTDIKAFTLISLKIPKQHDDARIIHAAKCGLNIDTATLEIVTDEINFRKQERDSKHDMTHVMAQLMDLTFRMKTLEKAMLPKDSSDAEGGSDSKW